MGIIVKTTAEFETQKEMLLRSITRAEKLITPMETIGEGKRYNSRIYCI